ncbi:MSMEG_4193 family putative phosphomutase [Micromonospora peucetia]|uniref:Probable phosphomutase, MSMEG_4193 family n=1 Tax=Micromonospora peucetia TaxID=47871 RepID=A0A1C6W4F4_9ACTN|nr:MSMEG_4193 family putative phosphomutase [Micromonospora peucetia]MCX4390469.1 MSMEG_4193 family putative phosphomutase [Micromonospora peucetia]SCL73090.1 probable phosphomutase, MSMEG_4193 family [Micromonospora peucetia]
MATLLLLRHGRTTANADGGLAGRQPVELDETGRAQATAVGERLRAVPLATVVSSPLIRCRQTLELALPAATPVLEEGLIECGYGAWEGQPLKKLAKEPLWPVVQQHPSAAVFPQGEAMAAMAARAVTAVRGWDARVTAEHGPEVVWLACSHGDVIKAIVADALGVHLDLFQRIVADPASVTAIRYTPLRPFLMRLNDTGGDLAGLVPPPPRGRRRRAARAAGAADSDAPVGGGAGAGR